ncbi:MAG: methyltransferase domain-containing protein [Candidatus Omnitrophota bacterium]
MEEYKKSVVKDYYGKVLKSQKDLKTSACCSVEAFPEPMKSIIKNIEPEILDKFYGCGSPLPALLEGCRVLDLGSGTGRDVYIASALVGEQGFVTGVDMTEEQLSVARKYKDAQMKRFGFKCCNVDFKKGYIEDLKEIGIEDNSQDVVISNCVINLSADKKKVFSEVFRVLKPGGELYFSDVFSDRRLPDEIKNDPALYGECLGGAMYIEDFRRLLKSLGCLDFRYMSKRKITIDDPKIAEKIGNITFCSMTIRAFKLDDLEDICEDFGQVAYYQGTISASPHQFVLDDHHVFFAHKPILVCGNTASMLMNTRLGKHFKIVGDRSRHFGPFPCGPALKQTDSVNPYSASTCC